MSDPYAGIAAIYDAEFVDATADIGTYVRDLDGCRRVLVLGCGTGRVSEGLRASGREVIGVDLSTPMIVRASRNATNGRVAGGVRYLVGDMCRLDAAQLGTFDAGVIPNAAFSFLPTRRDQVACLRGLAGLVAGPVWVDVPMPDFGLLGQAHTAEALAWAGRVDDVVVVRTREVFRRPVQQSLLLRDRYFLGEGGRAQPPAFTSDLALRLIFPAELEWLLESAGFYADRLYGDHAGGPVREGCDRLLVRALPLA